MNLKHLDHHNYEWINGEINPYEHPKWVYPHRRREVARNYFAWELMHGTPIDDLRKDSCWKYYEENEDAKT